MTNTATATTGIEAVREMARVLDTGPIRTSLDRGWQDTVAQRWRHGAFRESTAPMAEHVIMTYFGAARRIERWSDGKRVLSTTRPGSVTLIPAGQDARWDIGGSLDAIHLYVSPARLRALAEESDLPLPSTLIDRTGFADPVGSQILAFIAEELEAPSVLDALYAEQLSALVCTHLLRMHSTGARRPNNVFQGGLARARLSRVLAIMEERLSDDLPLGELAEVAGLSPFHFLRAFRQATGSTPHRRLVELRIDRAITLLTGSDVPLAEIAVTCGFASHSHMSTWFRRLKDTTPARIRAGR